MNKCIIIGRLTKEPEVKTTSSSISVCKFTVAVDRKFKDANGERQADFINCVAWRQTANFISSYFHKGSKIAIVGIIQTRTYDDQNGQRQFVTEVVVDEAEFVESKANNAPTKPNNYDSRLDDNDDLGYEVEDEVNDTFEF
jgi:single-strand DNA-binding protein